MQTEKIELFRYPRTLHLPWSGHVGADDKMMSMIDVIANFSGQEVVVTEKMDGENTSLYPHTMHARSLDSAHHPSRDYAKALWQGFASEIPFGFRICAENVYARHSIAYDNLPSFLLGFSIWNNQNICLSWDETLEYFQLLGITPVRELYRGVFDTDKISSLWNLGVKDTMEGYVVRKAAAFSYGQFRTSVAKFVRPNHVTTSSHWRYEKIIPNKLANG